VDRLYPLTVDTPGGTNSDAPQSTVWALEDSYLQSIEIIIPDGHVGLTGIRVTQAGTALMPYSITEYLVGNDERLVIPFNGEMTARGLVVETYNQDLIHHKHWLRAVVSDLAAITASRQSAVATVSNLVLSSAPVGLA